MMDQTQALNQEKTQASSAKQLKVFYDGECRLCAFEIQQYMKKDRENKIDFVDISHPKFNAESFGLDRKKVRQVMHTQTADGKFHTRVDAFVQIWKVLPQYQFLVPLAENRALRPLLEVGYTAFAKIRPFLPKNKNLHCDDEKCEI
ncbi:MAG: thiol-disulfide oxidoreductase DCC family protein [Pseudobdellovibrionaceae bacterium]|jgi:predicted DCC family thiol-disulfide oxidoreductase YuxK